jgi:predicted nuclease of predicted toxin-antitoxin system
VKFLFDAHLPYALCTLIRRRGLEAIHTRELPAGNATSDAAVSELSIREKWIVVSKDTDFYYLHLLHGKPFKLLLVRTGNLDRKSLVRLFEQHLDEVFVLLEKNTLVEIDRGAVRVAG